MAWKETSLEIVTQNTQIKKYLQAGIPDIENIMAISALFDISIDELLSNEKGAKKPADYLFESVTDNLENYAWRSDLSKI